ncbi:Nn.00g016510.m01.CDS01 [Neocucurbitaria sp. VM-36]
MAQPQTHVVHGGVQCPPPESWIPFEWEEPKLGKRVTGEVSIIRPFGTSGSLSAGLWRASATSPGCEADGSSVIIYSSPLGDETACVIEGTATLTVLATGQTYEVGPGSIISSPKGVEVEWKINGPFFKKFWCIWAGTLPVPGNELALQINHTSDNPKEWVDYQFTEPKEGDLVAGELYFIHTRGSTGTRMSGVWRSGKGIAASDCQADGTMTTPYTGTLGDETILLLEGEAEVTETESGKKHNFKAGDIIGLTSGMHITWVSKGPFTKKLWIITKDELPAAN